MKAESEAFQPGDPVNGWRRDSGDFVYPVPARVLAVTAKRVKILAEDLEESPRPIPR